MAASRAIIQTLFAIIVLSISAQVEGQLPTVTVSPPSVGATTNDQNIIINCSVPNLGQAITWHYNPNWDQTEIEIFNSYYSNVTTTDPANFSVAFYNYDLQGVRYTNADLRILVAKPGQAATYRCALSPATQDFGTSSFMVLDPIQCPAQDNTEYTAGAVVNISCSVNYHHRDEAGRVPVLQIYMGDPGIALPGTTTQNGTVLTTTASKVLTAEDDNLEYICMVTFANDDPAYSDNCSVVFFVLHGVSEMFFDPPSSADNPTSLAVGDQINCTANGRPEPTITWYNEQGDVVGEGQQLTITPDMESWAQPVSLLIVANNSIDGGLTYSSVEGNYTFTVGDGSMQVQSAGVEAWVIAVAVIVPVVVLTAIAIAVYFIIRHRKKKKGGGKKKKTTTTTNGSTTHVTTTSSSVYTPVATGEVPYASPNRPPPTSAPRISTNIHGPPGPDSRNGAIRVGDSPGFGDLGVQTYGGSTQAMNAYPPRSSVHGSTQALGMGVSMNPNPGYPIRASNPVLNSSATSSTRPNYPYQGSNSNLNVSLSVNQNPMAVPGVGYGRQPSVASSSGRSHASSYNAGLPGVEANRYPNDLSSMQGSEV